MKILHTSDWHLGVSLSGVSLLEEQQRWAQEIFEIVKTEQVEAVLIAGDIFDRAVASADTIALYDEIITQLAQDCGTAVLILAGNHDGAARLSSLGRLLGKAGVFIVGSLQQKPEPVIIQDTSIWLIPYFNPEQVRVLYADETIRTAHEAMCTVMNDIRARHDKRHKMIVGAHCFVTGASPAESDYGAQLGGAAQVGVDAFEGADYVALGHLHRAQQPAPLVRYSGSPYPYAFSESGNSVTLFDTVSGQWEERCLHPQRVPRMVRGTYDAVLTAAETDTKCDDYMKFELTDRAAGLEVLDILRTRYPNLIQLLGKSFEGSGVDTLTSQELRVLSPRELLARFCEDQGGFSPDERQIGAFLEAFRRIQEGDGIQ